MSEEAMNADPEAARSAVEVATTGEAKPQEHENRRRGIVAVVVLLVLLLLLCCCLWTQMGTVPNIVGMTREQAIATLKEAGFSAGDIRMIDRSSGEPGTVASQDPEPGLRRFGLAGVNFFVVRDDLGVPGDDATTSGGTTVFPEGSSAPMDDSMRYKGDDEYNLAGGSSASAVGDGAPLILDKTESDAKRIVSAAGYGYRVKRGPHAGGIVTGRVFFQEPAPGEPVTDGVMEMWISTGAPKEGEYIPENKPIVH